ncbi:MAG: prolyl oligopeptidase family serine peptidase, partial [Bacteroidota bacterium]
SMETDYPMIDFSARPADHEPIKYPFAGDSSHQVSIGVYDLVSGKTVYLQTGLPADQYLTNMAWSPDAQSVYVAVLNRGQDHMKLNRYSATTGVYERTLFEERDPMYTEPLHPMEFLPGDPSKFVWQSRRDGWNHLYLYDTSGKLIRQLTKGEWEVTDFNGFDGKGKTAFFHSTDNLGMDRVFKSVELSSGTIRLLTTGSGVHTCILNAQRTAFIDNWSSQTVPRVVRIVSARDGQVVETLLEAANPLADYTVGQTRTFTIQAADGKTPLWCRLILPADFDSTRKYPAVVYLYGGPHAQMITNTWLAGADLWFHYLTQQGYIVFTVDNRGSSNRGKAFEQATFRKLGEEEMRDQIAGVNALKAFRYVDASRLGVYGWSFGGFMTTSLMTRYPGVFKAAVAGGPVLDWSYYEVMYTERYMDTPAENPEGYRISKLTAQADQLNGKLLLIHGTSDDVVVWQHSLMFLKQAVSKGVQLDYFVYPGHLHNVTGKDRVHLNSKITGYFNDFLK